MAGEKDQFSDQEIAEATKALYAAMITLREQTNPSERSPTNYSDSATNPISTRITTTGNIESILSNFAISSKKITDANRGIVTPVAREVARPIYLVDVRNVPVSSPNFPSLLARNFRTLKGKVDSIGVELSRKVTEIRRLENSYRVKESNLIDAQMSLAKSMSSNFSNQVSKLKEEISSLEKKLDFKNRQTGDVETEKEVEAREHQRFYYNNSSDDESRLPKKKKHGFGLGSIIGATSRVGIAAAEGVGEVLGVSALAGLGYFLVKSGLGKQIITQVLPEIGKVVVKLAEAEAKKAVDVTWKFLKDDWNGMFADSIKKGNEAIQKTGDAIIASLYQHAKDIALHPLDDAHAISKYFNTFTDDKGRTGTQQTDAYNKKITSPRKPDPNPSIGSFDLQKWWKDHKFFGDSAAKSVGVPTRNIVHDYNSAHKNDATKSKLEDMIAGYHKEGIELPSVIVDQYTKLGGKLDAKKMGTSMPAHGHRMAPGLARFYNTKNDMRRNQGLRREQINEMVPGLTYGPQAEALTGGDNDGNIAFKNWIEGPTPWGNTVPDIAGAMGGNSRYAGNGGSYNYRGQSAGQEDTQRPMTASEKKAAAVANALSIGRKAPEGTDPFRASKRKKLAEGFDKLSPADKSLIYHAMKAEGDVHKNLEQLSNYAEARHMTLMQALHSGQFGPVNHNRVSSAPLSAQEQKNFAGIIASWKAGSNLIGDRTDQGMVGDPNYFKELTDGRHRPMNNGRTNRSIFGDHPIFDNYNHSGKSWAQLREDEEQNFKATHAGLYAPPKPETPAQHFKNNISRALAIHKAMHAQYTDDTFNMAMNPDDHRAQVAFGSQRHEAAQLVGNLNNKIITEARDLVARTGGNPQAVAEYMRRQGHPRSGNWCAEFVQSVMTGALGKEGAKDHTPSQNPNIASNWRRAPNMIHVRTPMPGDIAVADRGVPTGGMGSHVNIVNRVLSDGRVEYIGGNQGRMKETIGERYDYYRTQGTLSKSAARVLQGANYRAWLKKHRPLEFGFKDDMSVVPDPSGISGSVDPKTKASLLPEEAKRIEEERNARHDAINRGMEFGKNARGGAYFGGGIADTREESALQFHRGINRYLNLSHPSVLGQVKSQISDIHQTTANQNLHTQLDVNGAIRSKGSDLAPKPKTKEHPMDPKKPGVDKNAQRNMNGAIVDRQRSGGSQASKQDVRMPRSNSADSSPPSPGENGLGNYDSICFV